MNRDTVIKDLVHTFELKACELPDDTLQQIVDGKLVLQLARAVGGESGGVLSKAALSSQVKMAAVKKY